MLSVLAQKSLCCQYVIVPYDAQVGWIRILRVWGCVFKVLDMAREISDQFNCLLSVDLFDLSDTSSRVNASKKINC